MNRRRFIISLVIILFSPLVIFKKGFSFKEIFFANPVFFVLQKYIPYDLSQTDSVKLFCSEYYSRLSLKRKVFMRLTNLSFVRNYLTANYLVVMDKIHTEVVTSFVLTTNAERYYSDDAQSLEFYGIPNRPTCNPYAVLHNM